MLEKRSLLIGFALLSFAGAGYACPLGGHDQTAGLQSAEETARRIAKHRTGEEGQEGLHAFLEKRSASWRS